MGVASNLTVKLLNRCRWIGIAIIVYVPLDIIWEGGWELLALYNHA
ncbi:hypothetical protein FHX15_003515 [Rhizobium sp. BK650]|nr:hypothetical protein [Rhizobium sp. BK650]